MVVKNIRFDTDLKKCQRIENSNIDVYVELENGSEYIVTVGTVENIQYLMDNMNNKKHNCFGPGEPFIIVRKLTIEIIEETIRAYAEEDNGYWLKLHHFSPSMEDTVFENLEAKQIAQNIESIGIDLEEKIEILEKDITKLEKLKVHHRKPFEKFEKLKSQYRKEFEKLDLFNKDVLNKLKDQHKEALDVFDKLEAEHTEYLNELKKLDNS